MPDWDWKLRLFASADLVGSTEFKHANSENPEKWSATFQQFFEEFPVEVEDAYQRIRLPCPPCPPLTPWKFSGDEILFSAVISDHREVVTHLAAFKDAVKSFPMKWIEKGVALTLKASCWTAGFPVKNMELFIRSGASSIRDYIGPSIDLGFRITKFADTRRFVLSADLAFLALESITSNRCKDGALHIFLERREPLKGVIGNQPYPILWLDMHDGKFAGDEELFGVSRQCLHSRLRDYLEDFLTANKMMPFIVTDENSNYSAVPQHMLEKREYLMNIVDQTILKGDEPTDGTTGTDLKDAILAREMPETTGPDLDRIEELPDSGPVSPPSG